MSVPEVDAMWRAMALMGCTNISYSVDWTTHTAAVKWDFDGALYGWARNFNPGTSDEQIQAEAFAMAVDKAARVLAHRVTTKQVPPPALVSGFFNFPPGTAPPPTTATPGTTPTAPACPHTECLPEEAVFVALEMVHGKYWAENWQRRWEKAGADGFVLVKVQKEEA